MGKQRVPLLERYWPRVDKGPDCWLWIGGLDKDGYGQIGEGGWHSKKLKTHRLAWELAFGTIPDGLSVLHRCDNRACVNPDHLFLGTQADNMHDMKRKGRASKGERHPSTRLTADDVRGIRERRRNTTETLVAIGNRYGVKLETVYSIVHGRVWTHV